MEHRLPSMAVAVCFAAALAVRRRAPLAVLAVGLVVIELDNTVLKGLAEAGAFLLGIVIGIYSAGRYARGYWAAVSIVFVGVSIPLAAIEPGTPVAFTDFAFFGMFFGGPYVAGRVIRHRREREQQLEDETGALKLERDLKAREAVAEERVRIARELHDVVAHAISVIVLQARGGRRVLRAIPERRARRSMRSSARASRRSRRCVACSGCCATATRSSRLLRSRALPGSTTSRRASPRRGCRSRCASRGRRSTCRREST